MRPPSRFAPLTSALAALVIASVLASCASAPASRPLPPTEELRSRMRVLAVTSADTAPTVVFTGPAKGGLEGAWRGARLGLLVPMMVGGATGLGAAVGVALAPIGALLGASIGAEQARTAADIEVRESVVRQALTEATLQERLRDCVTAAVREQAPHVTVAAASGSAGRDMMLQVVIEEAGLSGDTWLFDPPLQLVLHSRARIVSASDGRVLYATAFNWSGQLRSLEDWAAEDGDAVKAEVGRACRDVAEALVDEVFLVYRPQAAR